MNLKIRKRDGRLVKFNAEKITNAIAKAGAATGEFDIKEARKLTIKVLNLAEKLFDSKVLTVEEIQDVVEEVLLQTPYRKTAKSYIIYRDQHSRLRDITNKMEVDLVDQYLKKLDWKINENSNMDYSLQGLNNYISSEVSKVYWLNEIYSPEIHKAHTDGDFHIHDLSLLSVYCVGWDLYDLLLQGFQGVSGKVESKPANHLRSALGQVVNFFYTFREKPAGAQAFSDCLIPGFEDIVMFCAAEELELGWTRLLDAFARLRVVQFEGSARACLDAFVDVQRRPALRAVERTEPQHARHRRDHGIFS